MLPPSELLPAVFPTDRLGAKGVARPDLRARYRKIPNARNAFTVVAALLQTIGVVVAAGVVNTWWAYLAAPEIHPGMKLLPEPTADGRSTRTRGRRSPEASLRHRAK